MLFVSLCFLVLEAVCTQSQKALAIYKVGCLIGSVYIALLVRVVGKKLHSGDQESEGGTTAGCCYAFAKQHS